MYYHEIHESLQISCSTICGQMCQSTVIMHLWPGAGRSLCIICRGRSCRECYFNHYLLCVYAWVGLYLHACSCVHTVCTQICVYLNNQGA